MPKRWKRRKENRASAECPPREDTTKLTASIAPLRLATTLPYDTGKCPLAAASLIYLLGRIMSHSPKRNTPLSLCWFVLLLFESRTRFFLLVAATLASLSPSGCAESAVRPFAPILYHVQSGLPSVHSGYSPPETVVTFWFFNGSLSKKY